MSDQFGHYPLKARHRNLVKAWVEFTGTDGASPPVASVVDSSGVLASGTTLGDKVERTAEGVYRLKLRHDWQSILAHAAVVSTAAGDHARMGARSTTSGANTVDIYCEKDTAGTQTADDLDGKTVCVELTLSLSDDAP